MSSQTLGVDSDAARPPYSEWRGLLLAESGLARAPGLTVNRQHASADLGYDFLVATERGACFLIEVKAFSSMRLGSEEVDSTAEWRWRIITALVRCARESRSPFFCFVFDADTDHGRFLRPDTLPGPDPKAKTVDVRLPREDADDGKALERIATGLEAARTPEPPQDAR
jgi:hypothetical protein